MYIIMLCCVHILQILLPVVVNLVILQTKTRFHSISHAIALYLEFFPSPQAMDIDELLNPGDPVYFNYANLPANRVPSSLKAMCIPRSYTSEYKVLLSHTESWEKFQHQRQDH